MDSHSARLPVVACRTIRVRGRREQMGDGALQHAEPAEQAGAEQVFFVRGKIVRGR